MNKLQELFLISSDKQKNLFSIFMMKSSSVDDNIHFIFLSLS